jgi:hypothetical protein
MNQILTAKCGGYDYITKKNKCNNKAESRHKKIFFESIRALPKKWISDNTQVAYTEKNVIAVNPKYPPIIYIPKTGWTKLLGNYMEVNALKLKDNCTII